MKTFEDLGFYCVEHLPPDALDATLATFDAAGVESVAIALDTRLGSRLGDALAAIDRASANRRSHVLYLEARNDVLVRRFSETRRRHPYASRGSVREAIAAERDAMLPLRERATMTIDTTTMTHGDLKERLVSTFAPGARALLAVTIEPFGFKYGLPLDLDLLFDVRFLRNPNYDDALRPLTGEDPGVASFIEADPACAPFVSKLLDLMDFLIPRYIAEGKAQLTIGIGCTGGRHRSVYVAERLAAHLRENERVSVTMDLRDTSRHQ